MLMRRLLAALGPVLLCLVTCALYRWLDERFGGGDFWRFALKGVLLGVCVALLLPVAGISVRSNGLIPMLWVGAGLLLAALGYQYLDAAGVLRWELVRAVRAGIGQAVLADSAAMSFQAVTAALNGKRRAKG